MAVPSLASIRQAKAAENQERDQEIARLVAESQQFEADGDLKRAKARLRSAIKKATGLERYELQLRLESLEKN